MWSHFDPTQEAAPNDTPKTNVRMYECAIGIACRHDGSQVDRFCCNMQEETILTSWAYNRHVSAQHVYEHRQIIQLTPLHEPAKT
jgi:hypothetical protein